MMICNTDKLPIATYLLHAMTNILNRLFYLQGTYRSLVHNLAQELV